ncbi:hypothetical protein [uncultured Campylobacter sp.]|uniref:hypothetical protein n=1 Tax=uncultured Campylobacter sp. TaxID=218934 RepID=UPI0028E47C99|nr:hypothetical protein [uncultured Campylobacter sp.]
MKLIGHELVPYEPLFWRENARQIEAGKQNLFKFDAASIKRAQELGAQFSVEAENLNEVIVANAAGAKFIIMPRELAGKAAKLAQDYLFDAQICAFVESENELAALSETGADVAIFKTAVIGKDKR